MNIFVFQLCIIVFGVSLQSEKDDIFQTFYPAKISNHEYMYINELDSVLRVAK